jgi:serine/threonine protein kinase
MVDPHAFQNSRPPASQAGLKPSGMLGRFELRRQLGQGAQSTVWLAFDPRMEREVAIKVLRPTAGADELAVKQWLQEARSVGRVKHPSIVPVFEADIHEQYPYLVFEYVAGDTLAQLLARRGALPAREAAALMMDVLDAVAVAHTEGVVHRDIKPSNVLVDGTGRARVMDFGIAARVRNRADNAAVAVGGTVGYMSPEALAGAPPVPSMDLFACGLVLAELLMGKPLVEESDSNRALYRTAHEQLVLPQGLGPDVDDGLRSLVNRALARDPQQRFGDARTFFNALSTWRQPPATESDSQGGSHSGGTLEFLMRRMRHKSDFPALSASVVQIQTMASSDTESVSSVTNQILKDVALTNKLLRVVNSAHFARGGSISTVSRAVTLVGFNGIRNMALSLVLLEHMQDKGHAAQLKDEFVRSLLAATLGSELCTNSKDAEEAFIGAMFQNMGRLLVQFYFPEEAAQVRSLLVSETPVITEAAASLRVLGLSYENLGIGIAKAWGLPASIQKCMKLPAGGPPAALSADAAERMRWVSVAANEMADVMLKYPPEETGGHLTRLARKYAHAVGSSEKLMAAAVEQAKTKLVEMATAMEIRVKPDSAAHKLLHVAVDAPVSVQDKDGPSTDSQINSLALHATQAVGAATQVPVKSTQVAETLAAGIQDITNAMVEDFKLSDVLRMILETMFRAMDFDRIIFCMRDPKTESMTGRFGLGDGVEDFAKCFKVPLKAATPDLFGVVCIKGVDSMISDASEPRILQRLPAWYLQSLNAPAFLLLPLHIKGAPFGLIYADKTKKGALELDEKELALLRTLRNQAVMAFKQSR